MNIIIHRYNSICEPDYIDAFKKLGIDVIEDCSGMADKKQSLEKRVANLGEMIIKNHPLFVFSINFFPFISMVCEKLGVKYVCVSVDCPVEELFSNMIVNKCNRVFLFDYRQYMDVREFNPECIFHMPLGVNVDRIDQTIGSPDWDKMASDSNAYKYDVSFVGSLYDDKNRMPKVYKSIGDRFRGMCDGLLAAQELMNGQQLLEQTVTDELIAAIKKSDSDFYSSELSICNLDAFVAVNDYLSMELTVRDRFKLMRIMPEVLSEYGQVHLFTRSDTDKLKKTGTPINIHGGVKTLTEMPLVFRESKINLNPTMRSIQAGLPQRIWDVLGCGGFLMTNYQAEIPEYFEIGKHLEAYESIEEACEKAAYYLTHEEERLEIAKAGYELVKNNHTVVQRVMEIIRIISAQ